MVWQSPGLLDVAVKRRYGLYLPWRRTLRKGAQKAGDGIKVYALGA